MAAKTAVFVGAEAGSLTPRMARVELASTGYLSQRSADSLLRDAIGYFVDESPALRKGSDAVEKQNYQLALVPLPNLAKQTGTDGPVLAKMNSVFVLPLTWKDLVARLRAEGGRSKSNQPNDVVVFGAIWVKFSSMEVRRAGKPVTITPLEFKLLRYFIFNPATVISRIELLNEVWGFENYPCTRTVDTHVWRLRQKLESDPVRPAHFLTVRAMGYKFLP